MDKLQPLIRHHFWILSGLIIPLVLYGFYSANGQLRAATQARETRLDQVKSGVSSGREPNDDYITKLKFINGSLEAYVDDAIVDLWKHQQARMTWPRLVADKIPAEFLADFNQQVPLIYKGTYDEAYRRLQERVQPVRPLDPMVAPNPKAPIAPNQKVILMANLPQANFGQFGVTSQEMWDAQIDIWMTELLLDAIVKVNQDKESVRESVIRRLDRLELVGGTGEPATADSGMSGEGGMAEFEGGMGRSGRMGASPNIKAAVAFNPAEEFGPEIATAGGGGDMMMDMSMGEGGSGGPTPPKRYIGEDDESKPFLERGFYMSVIIQQSKIADFIVQLANSDWPVQVKRFQVGANPYRVAQSRSMTDSFSGEMSDFNLPAFEASPEGGFSGNRGNYDAGVYRSGDRTAALRPNPFATNLPPFAAESMNHPDLVQLDLCGVITMYKQPKETLAAVEARKAAAGQTPQNQVPQDAVNQEVPVTPASEPGAAPAESAPPESAPPESAPSAEPTTEATAEEATTELVPTTETPAPTAPSGAAGAPE